MVPTPRLLLLPLDPAAVPREMREMDREPFTLGREADNALILNGQGVSRHHAQIQRCPEGWKVVDLGSSNGTLVNGARVQSQVLRHGDEVFLGDRGFRFLWPPEAIVPLPPPLPAGLVPPIPSLQPPLPPPFPPAYSPAYQPPLPNARRSRPLLWAGVGAGAMAMVALGAFWFLRPKNPDWETPQATVAELPPATPPTVVPAPTPPSAIPTLRPPEVMADPEALAESLKTRFQNGDLEGVLSLSHPEMRENFRKAFHGERERMARAANLLATRKAVTSESGSLVEFEVRDGERTFPLTFERLGNTWVLRSM